jgi:N4-gp56 family major capsid protein
MPGGNPASNLVSNLPQAQAKFYDKNFYENLKFQTPFVRVAERRNLPLNSGNTMVFFEYPLFGANTNQSAEGTVGSGLQITPLTNQCTIGEYSDFASFSTLAVFTAIDPVITNVSKELAYRLGQSLSILVRTAFESANSIDSSVSGQSKSGSSTVTILDIRSAVQSLAGRAVLPFDKNRFAGVIHPFVTGDIMNDAANNSLVDIYKHTSEGLGKLQNLPGVDMEEVIDFPGTGVYFHQSSLVTQTANYNATGKVGLRTYILGHDGVVAVDLIGAGDTAFGDGRYQSIKPLVRQNVEPSVADMAGVINGWTSYRLHFTTTLAPDTTGRGRYIDADTGVS